MYDALTYITQLRQRTKIHAQKKIDTLHNVIWQWHTLSCEISCPDQINNKKNPRCKRQSTILLGNNVG